MKPEKTFKDFLESEAMKDYHGDKEHWENYYSNWLEDCQGYWVELGEKYAESIRKYYESLREYD